MKKVARVLLTASLLFNVYFTAAWGLACYAYPDISRRKTYFSRFLGGVDPRTLSIVAAVVTLLSLAIFLSTVRTPRGRCFAIVIVQVLFGLLYLWQLL
ncbi:hypothetical protein [Dyadobacter crusticola]|uniref:hypothetical protein n=1 Tax=Dyadobacter crusticola TaxID=292407 RepID=UPI0004E12337|nr:hypothetical protein [Dyadobacter crusticola]